MKYVIQVVWRCIKGINYAVAPKIMALKNLIGLNHKPHTDLEQKTTIGNHPYPLHHALFCLRYDNLLGECLGDEEF